MPSGSCWTNKQDRLTPTLFAMKQILVLVFCMAGFHGIAQKDSLLKLPPPLTTAFGKPSGETVSKNIGPEGGTILAADGITTLDIPAGALSAVTTITVQPVTNMVQGGKGNAYHFEPSGLQFSKPALLTINIPGTEAKQTTIVPQKISWQDASGTWHRLKNSTYDSVQHLVSAPISHFSDYARQLNYSLNPDKAELYVNESQGFLFRLDDVLPEKYQIMIEEEEMSYAEVIRRLAANDVKWLVNDIPGGNDVVGRIIPNKDVPMTARYYAPHNVPGNNPVTIQARVSGKIYNGTGYTNGAEATAVVTIIDEYNYTFIGYSTSGVFHMIDSSSCKIRVDGKNVRIYGIQNYPAWSDWPAKAGGCTYTYTNKGTWKGLVEITGLAYGVADNGGANNKVTISNDKLTHVMIGLLPAIGNTPGAISKCPGWTANIPSQSLPAQPQTIEFDMNDYDVTIHFGGEQAKNELKHIVRGEGFIVRITRVERSD